MLVGTFAGGPDPLVEARADGSPPDRTVEGLPADGIVEGLPPHRTVEGSPPDGVVPVLFRERSLCMRVLRSPSTGFCSVWLC